MADRDEVSRLLLNAQTLGTLPAAVHAPGYERGQVTVGIVHIGVGGFHRSHQAVYLDDLMNAGLAPDWGICGVGVLAQDRVMRDVMRDQDCLYTVVTKAADRREYRVVGSIVEYLFAPDDPEAVIERMADPAVRVVSLTITEGGYHIDPVSGDFTASDPAVQRDLRPDAAPATVFGLVTEALVRRRRRHVAPFAVVSCDNIESNGDVARRSFCGFAAMRDPLLGQWMADDVQFPNSMVDRITPATTAADRAELAAAVGLADQWPVVCEPFRQWVVEDGFGGARPPLESAGVQVVEDVRPYELMKLRLLNASHQALAYFGFLAGYRFVHEPFGNPVFAKFLRAYMRDEAALSLSPVPGVDLVAYQATLLERFANPAVRDTIERLCAYTSDRIPKFLLPVAQHNVSSGGPVRLTAAVVASWARYAQGVDDAGRPIDVVDSRREVLQAAAAEEREAPGAFLAVPGIFGSLRADERFKAAYLDALELLRTRGSLGTLGALTSDVEKARR